jgi:hypothetical protein
MQARTNVKAGGISTNHNQSFIRATGLKVKTKVKAGGAQVNHNQALVRARV